MLNINAQSHLYTIPENTTTLNRPIAASGRRKRSFHSRQSFIRPPPSRNRLPLVPAPRRVARSSNTRLTTSCCNLAATFALSTSAASQLPSSTTANQGNAHKGSAFIPCAEFPLCFHDDSPWTSLRTLSRYPLASLNLFAAAVSFLLLSSSSALSYSAWYVLIRSAMKSISSTSPDAPPPRPFASSLSETRSSSCLVAAPLLPAEALLPVRRFPSTLAPDF